MKNGYKLLVILSTAFILLINVTVSKQTDKVNKGNQKIVNGNKIVKGLNHTNVNSKSKSKITRINKLKTLNSKLLSKSAQAELIK
jgi:hypothetical protein